MLNFSCGSEFGWITTNQDPETGMENFYCQFKSDQEIYIEGKRAKYLIPKHAKAQGIFLDVPNELQFWPNMVQDPTIPIFITEGAIKSASLLDRGYAAIAVTGVWQGQVKRQRLISDLQLFVKPGRTVYLCFDSDSKTNLNVDIALKTMF